MAFKRLLQRHPWWTNAVIAGACTSLGDCITQKFDPSDGGSMDAGAGAELETTATSQQLPYNTHKSFDYRRNLAYTVFGAVWSVPGRIFYQVLATRVPTDTLMGAVKGGLLGEFCLDLPITTPIFFASTDYMRGRDTSFVVDHLVRDYKTTAASSFCVWFPAQVVNLRFVPLRYRVIFDSVCVVAWSAIFSFLTNRKLQSENERVNLEPGPGPGPAVLE